MNQPLTPSTKIDCNSTIDEYISQSDWRVNANANIGYCNAGLVTHAAGKAIANYWLDKVYTKEEGDAHRQADYHIHDLDCLTGYCAGWSLRQVLNEGFNIGHGRVGSKPPRHFREALGQMANYLGVLQMEWAGAQAFSSFDTYLAPYVFRDKLDYEQIKKAITQFIFNVNVPARWGQSPFTNITLDIDVPDDLKETFPTAKDIHLFRGIQDQDLLDLAKLRDPSINTLEDMKYKHFESEMEQITLAYYEVMTTGDANGQPFTFPIPTVNITEAFDWNSKVADAIFTNSAKMGCSYFQNFVGSQYKRDEQGNRVENPEAYKPGAVRSMCPLPGYTLVPILFTIDGIEHFDTRSIEDIHSDHANGLEFKVKYGDDWYEASTNKTRGTTITLTLDSVSSVSRYQGEVSSEKTIVMLSPSEYELGNNHLQPVLRTNSDGSERVITVKGADILIGDSIPYMVANRYRWVKVINIRTNTEEKDLYCFEVKSEKHLFELSSGIVTHNCRLQLDLRELLKRGNGLFGSAEMTGSIGVVTINMARLGFLNKGDEEKLFNSLDKLMDLAKNTLEKKRLFIQDMYNRGLYPYTKRYLRGFMNHFSTIGINGMNEMVRNFSNDKSDLTSREGIELSIRILEYMRSKLKVYQEETGHLYNLEATPAEGTTYRFAKEDHKKFGESIIQAGVYPNIYYTNSSQTPVDFSDDPFEVLDLQDDLQCKYTGGTVQHLYMSEQISSGEACKNLVKNVIENYRLPYITITPVFSVCDEHGYLKGEQHECPYCGAETKVWTRVMGYFRPVANFNIGKKGEFYARKWFKEPEHKSEVVNFRTRIPTDKDIDIAV